MRWRTSTFAALVLLAVALVSASGGAQRAQTAKPPPPATLTAGKKLFANNCAACHGPTGEGGDGPNLHRLAMSNAAIGYAITHGFKNQMPAFTRLSASDQAALVAMVKSFK